MRVEHQAEERGARTADAHHEGDGRALTSAAPGELVEEAHRQKRLGEPAPELGIALDVGEDLGAEGRGLLAEFLVDPSRRVIAAAKSSGHSVLWQRVEHARAAGFLRLTQPSVGIDEATAAGGPKAPAVVVGEVTVDAEEERVKVG